MKIKSWVGFLPLLLFSAVFCNFTAPLTPTQTALNPVDIQVTATLVIPSATSGPASGSIAGHLSYPSEVIPELRVVAFDAVDVTKFYFVDTVQNQSTYRIDSIPAGTYHVVAYVLDPASKIAGGYSQAVPCGLQVGCNDHTLMDVVVVEAQVTENINPGDWYATEGAFPPRPGP